MKTLYLHLGTPKTATTSIQNFCYRNQAVLNSKGYCYPDMPFKYPGKGKRRNGLFLSSIYKDENGKRRKDIEAQRFDEGIEIVNGLFSDYDNVILSDEGLWWAVYKRNYSMLEKLVEFGKQYGYQVKAIVYFRRQDDYIDSWWNQRVKQFKDVTMTYDECVNNNQKHTHLDYYTELEIISNAIGKENITVRRFDEVVKGEGIHSDFLNAIGLELTDEYVLSDGLKHLNTRLYGNTVEIKRIINELDDITESDNKFILKMLSDCTGTSKKLYPCSMMSDAETAEFMAKYAEENRKIEEEYLNDNKPLFSDDYTCNEKWDKSNPAFIDDAIRFSATTDIYLYNTINDLNKKITDLQKIIKEQNKAHKEEIKRINKEHNKEIKLLNNKVNKIHYNMKHPITAFIKMIVRKLKG